MKIQVRTTEATYIFDNAIEIEFEADTLYAHAIPNEEGKQGYRFEDTTYDNNSPITPTN